MGKKLSVCLDCPELTDQARCPKHRQQARAEYRRDEDPRYGTARWKHYRATFKADHPQCVNASKGIPGCTLVTDVVDHIISVKQRPDLFWEPSNHRPACQACNQRFAREAASCGGPVLA